MHQLHGALEEDGGLREALAALSDRTAGNPLKHALVLDLNPFWRAAYHLADSGLSDDIIIGWPDIRFGAPLDLGAWLSASGVVQRATGPFDLSRRFEAADQMTNRLFGDCDRLRGGPYIFRIFALPGSSETLKTDPENRRKLVEAARKSPIPTVVETQDAVRLVAAPGDGLVAPAGVLGTLGGFLKDRSRNTVYAVTCGHVIASGTPNCGGVGLGPCVYAAAPLPLNGAVCQAGCGAMTELDVALIDIQRTAFTNVATSVAKLVSPGDIVAMSGAATGGTVDYEVGGAVVELAIGGSCWDRLYLFHAPVSSGLLPVGVKVAMTPPPKGGDSGAWLVRGQEWAGMVVAGNSLLGYALAGTQVIAASNAQFGTQLDIA
ncbi:hypothetical protein [Rhodopseudomonas palustris]|uniref:Uncharacterized protein n=1 Tax=Rhodopseudomonas palustris (strain ATCC BAA-98 / CGA009) TaxID=258594 RepID=Q6N4E3_RHOPA|nr:hypothetical protein [Rhodopseudomonas palustris]OPF96622.1 hypothetical protein B1S06_03435 [Rhodopseudomonas palustris]PPQ44099.1 hypothetical protein CKO39_07625 [Rhodopseudomonas palustris]QQM04932.1 hypothetical protein I8G32_03497 [Rhodopseudomonas palustris]RJF65072.1 hypothetical protein D4Q71_09790 [Rhodopseudomonas palustris]WAB76298.1 hypothetical protein OR798_17565 [Rhodopseudomonas palustris]